MKRIISVSRRTDVPAFYGDWFMARLKEGFAGVVNPFGGQRCIVSLRPQDVVCFVFWSKNFAPFLEDLEAIDRMGYKFYFNYTVTGLPNVFESNVEKQAAIETLKQLSQMYSPLHINWRFDPVIISSICDSDFKIDLANELAAIAEHHGIQMFSCCGDYLVNERIKKAHCIDGSIVEQLFSPTDFLYSYKPTRKECGCTESADIGTYDTCPHGCIYCYANMNKPKALEAFENYDKSSAFLGYSKPQSDRWLAEIKTAQPEEHHEQLKML
jgi:hypothetical protein